MQALLFHLRRVLYSLGDAVFVPFRFLSGLWSGSARGRILLYGLPCVAVFLFAVVTTLFAWGRQSSLISTYEASRQTALEEGERSEAITYSYKLMQLKPEDEAIKYELAQLLASDESEETSRQNKQRAFSMFQALAPDDRVGYPPAHVSMANYWLNRGDKPPKERLRTARQQLQLALSGDADLDQAKLLLANVETAEGNIAAALDLYIDVFEKHVRLYRKIAECYARLGRAVESHYYMEQAVSRYRELLEQDPENVEYQRHLGFAMALMKDFDGSIEFLEQARADQEEQERREFLSRALSDVWYSRAELIYADLMKDQGEKMKSDAAMRDSYLEALRSSFQANQANELTRRRLVDLGNQDFPQSLKAREIYDPRVDVEGASDEILWQMGTNELLNGNQEQAIAYLEKGLQMNINNHAILNNLAMANLETDPETSLQRANRAIQLAPGQPTYHHTRAEIRMAMGDYREAITDFQEAIRLFRAAYSKQGLNREPPSRWYYSLADAYEKMGLGDDAASYRTRADQIKLDESRASGDGGR